MSMDQQIEETMRRVETLDLRHAWGVLTRLQQTLLAGPWETEDYPAAVQWQRRDRYGDAVVTVSYWKATGAIETKVREDAPRRDDVFPRTWIQIEGMESLEAGRASADEALTARSWKLVPSG